MGKPKKVVKPIKKKVVEPIKKVAKKVVVVKRATRKERPVEYETEQNEPIEEESPIHSAFTTEVSTKPVKWVRGILPGNKLIKTDPATGVFKEIDKKEWDSLY